MQRVAITTAATIVFATSVLGACSTRASRSASAGPAVAAAGGSTGAAGAAFPVERPPIDVCALLTAEQASAISGLHYRSAQPSHNMCSYIPTDAPMGMFIIITPGAGGDAAWQDALATLRADGGAPAPISGVGDRAAGSGTQMDVQAGDHIIDVHGGDPNAPTGVFITSIAIAKAIIPKLK